MVFSMQDFLVYLVQKIWTIVTVTLACTLIALGGSYFFIEPTYSASFSLYIHNVSDATNKDNVTISDLNASQELLNTYIAILTSDSLLKDVANDLPNHSLSPAAMKKQISATSVNKTELLKVTVSDYDANVALDISHSLQKLSPAFITNVVKAGSVEVVDPATQANLNSRPLLKNTLIGAAVGLIGVIGFLFAFFILDTRIWDETDLMEKFTLPIIGTIPGNYFDDNKKVTKPHDLVLSKNTSFAISEAYRAARINLFKIAEIASSAKCHTFVFTSAKPEEGKTITSINMALTLAQNDKKVLLIDADFRKPQVRNYMQIPDNPSFIEYLGGYTEYVDIVELDDMPLHILATATSHPYPAELLSTERMWSLIEKFKDSFDYIIIDTPPLEYVIDAAVISNIADGYVIISRAGFSRSGQVVETVRKLEQLNATVSGFILNDIDPKRCGLGSRYHIYNYTEKYEPYYR